MNQFAPMPSRRTRQFCALATVAAIVAGGVAWNRHLNAAPTFAIPAPAPLTNPNAFDDFVRAASLHREPDVYKGSGKTVTLTPAQIDAVFADNAAAIQALHVGFTHPFQQPTVRSMKDSSKGFEHFAAFRSLARTLSYEAQQRAARGDAAGAMDTGLDGLQMGVMLPRGGNEISLLVGIACDAIARKNLWAVVGKLDAAQAANAAHRLEAIDAQRTSLADTLEEEKWQGLTTRLDLLQKQSVTAAYRELVQPSSSSGSDTEGATNSGSGHPFRDWLSLSRLSKQQVVDDYAAWMDAQIAAIRQPYNQPRKSSPVAPAASADLLNQTLEGLEGMSSGDDADTLGRRVQFKDAADRTDDGLLTTMLALRAYRLQTGSFPANLNALVTSGLLRALPADPFARTADAPFVYRQLSGDNYRLYSVGPDGMDDGGRPIDLTKSPVNRSKYAVPYLDAGDRGDWVVSASTPIPGKGAK